MVQWLEQYRYIDVDIQVMKRVSDEVGTFPDELDFADITDIHDTLVQRKTMVERALKNIESSNRELFLMLSHKFIQGQSVNEVRTIVQRNGNALTPDRYRTVRNKALNAFWIAMKEQMEGVIHETCSI